MNSYDHEGTLPVAIVNEALARLLFDNENPIGRHVRMSSKAADPGVEIVGVVETGKYEYLGEDPHPAIFLPIAQTETGWTTLVARTRLPAQAATELLRKTVLDLNPDLALFNIGSLKDQLALPLFPARIAAIVLGIFGLLAMVLAATGMFALMAYTVSRRTREIGIRMALGAARSRCFHPCSGAPPYSAQRAFPSEQPLRSLPEGCYRPCSTASARATRQYTPLRFLSCFW